MRLSSLAAALLTAFLLLAGVSAPSHSGPLTEGPFVGKVATGETDTYAYAKTSPLEKWDPKACKNDWPKLHIVSLRVQTTGTMLLRVTGIETGFPNEETTVDGLAEVWIDLNYDACPSFTVEVVGLDVPEGAIEGLYRVDVQTNLS